MLNISYTRSPYLLEMLSRIEDLRREILLFPLSPKRELQLQFSRTLERIQQGLLLEGERVSKNDIAKTLSVYKSSRLTKPEQKINAYKKIFDYLRQNWLVNLRPIDVKDITLIHSLISEAKLDITDKDIKEVLDYLQATPESPIIQAALAKMVFSNLSTAPENNLLSTIYCYLFFYKAGLDFRGTLVLENISQTEIISGNVTLWLEYFVKSVHDEMTQVISDMQEISHEGIRSSLTAKFWELSERQRAILSLLDNPNVVITNRSVQKIFSISQITASRDLAKLLSLGLLFVHGKGRSVRYTKV